MATSTHANTEGPEQELLTVSKSIRDALEPYLPPREHETEKVQDNIARKDNDENSTGTNNDHNTDKKDDISIHADLCSPSASPSKPYVTLTYASSLDSTIAVAPNMRTALSGPQSKAMTHYLRSRHDAILVGVGTAIADDPGLNCRLDAAAAACMEKGHEGVDDSNDDDNVDIAKQHKPLHPRPVIIDPSARYELTRESKIYRLAKDGLGKGPWVFCGSGPVSKEMMDVLAECGGEYMFHALDGVDEKGEGDRKKGKKRTSWEKILTRLGERGIRTVMVEGGGRVINELLEGEMRRLVDEGENGSGSSAKKKKLVDAVVLTIAPLYLGVGGVVACPERPAEVTPSSASSEIKDGEDETDDENDNENKEERQHPHPHPPNWQGLRLKQVKWIPMEEDVVICGVLT